MKKLIMLFKRLRSSTIHPTANLYGDWKIGKGTKVGAFCDIGGWVGKNCKIQALVFIPKGVYIQNDVFVGPGTVFTNDKYAPSNDRQITVIHNGVSIGANCTILPGIHILENAIIGAGSVVTKDVYKGQTWYGNPAKKVK